MPARDACFANCAGQRVARSFANARAPQLRSRQTRLQDLSFKSLLHGCIRHARARSRCASLKGRGVRGWVPRRGARGVSCVKTPSRALRGCHARGGSLKTCTYMFFKPAYPLLAAQTPYRTALEVRESPARGPALRRSAPHWSGRKPNRQTCLATASGAGSRLRLALWRALVCPEPPDCLPAARRLPCRAVYKPPGGSGAPGVPPLTHTAPSLTLFETRHPTLHRLATAKSAHTVTPVAPATTPSTHLVPLLTHTPTSPPPNPTPVPTPAISTNILSTTYNYLNNH